MKMWVTHTTKKDHGEPREDRVLTFVALSRAMNMGCFVFDPAPDFERMRAVGNAKQLPNRLLESQRIERLSADTLLRYRHLDGTSLK